jgi:hypothetical protein
MGKIINTRRGKNYANEDFRRKQLPAVNESDHKPLICGGFAGNT